MIKAEKPHKPFKGKSFFIDIPESIEHSFYSGKVFVSYKNTLFQLSSAIRHATEFYNATQSHYGPNIPPILCLYTDGDPDYSWVPKHFDI